MLQYPKISLAKNKEISILRKHHWIFSGAIAKRDKDLENGQLVQVYSAKDAFLGIGHFQNGSIMVRIISFEEKPIDQIFWNAKIQSALAVRNQMGLIDHENTDVYRLIHGEGDGLPGLIIDFYNGTAVIQAHSIGMHHHIEEISNALQNAYGNQLAAVYDKSAETLPKNLPNLENKLIFGEPKTNLVKENGCIYEIDWEKGQKTGFFVDQRDNRQLFGQYSKNKKVLNTFCYSGGFSVSALKAGAKEVHSIDISAKAIELTDKNVALNAGSISGKHESIVADVVKYIKEIEQDYDVIVLDPPAFAKNMKSRHNAVQAYKRLNAEAFKHIKSGGILFTFSCSQVVDKQLFTNTITAAAMESGRNIRILHFLSQPPDHPINIYHQETAYLKGLVVHVE
ncbi:class I SAM-dependent rRNA methyltransferase [Belliella kenyensis]|uniref:Class I SAM-dependent rRNA methyltransferase n=1 Tax=Belliella kenyensis TaxID=1472724 RepID=A0ABV8EJE0_9BACT|nr:class I SAM-dependent rRNA methyltransferase [Belliella kenyensis]MCH7403527.1 class I SAM-dependent rRNA methyltransferase [Belliella kenyensis]MDN3604951.1 class I SAM-dependent rRNA methyltransferase [Belliella kenyensis]